MKKEKREEQILNTEKSKTISSKKSSTTKEILLITYLFVFLFLGMMGYLIKFMLVDSEEVINNSFNPKQEILASRNIRGTIYSNNMEILAETLTDQAGNEYRNYPFENLFSHVVGYSSNGKMGVELLANYQLLSCDAFIGGKVQKHLSNLKYMGSSVVTTFVTE